MGHMLLVLTLLVTAAVRGLQPDVLRERIKEAEEECAESECDGDDIEHYTRLYLQLGNELLEKNETGNAITAFEKASKASFDLGVNSPTHSESVEALASTFAAVGRFGDALPLYHGRLTAIMEEELRADRMGAEADKFRLVLKKARLAVLQRLGELAFRAGEFDEAVDVMDQAFSLTEKEPTLVTLSEALGTRVELARALAHTNRAAVYQRALSLAFSAVDTLQQQRDAISTESQVKPPLDLPIALEVYASVLNKMGQQEDAIEAMQQANELVKLVEGVDLVIVQRMEQTLHALEDDSDSAEHGSRLRKWRMAAAQKKEEDAKKAAEEAERQKRKEAQKVRRRRKAAKRKTEL